MSRRLYRSKTDRMIWGVCGGLAKYFDVDPVIIRLIFIISLFLSGAGIIAYIILAIVVPSESSQATEPGTVVKENVQEIKDTAESIGKEFQAGFSKETKENEDSYKSRNRSLFVLGILIIIIGVIFLIGNLTNFWVWVRWIYVWPVLLIAVGILILLSRRGR